jgi:uncharacterized membrane protein YdcZ (DUF606 family)
MRWQPNSNGIVELWLLPSKKGSREEVFDLAKKLSIDQYQYWYSRLLLLYPQPFYNRFGEEMKQSFTDLLRERINEERGLFSFAVWIFIETSVGIFSEKRRDFNMQLKNIVRPALISMFILLLPLLAMQFTDQVVWDLADFAIAGVFLFGAGLIYEFVASKRGSTAYRAAVGLAVATALLLVWTNLAVGIIGNEENPANLIYGGVLAVGFIGAIITRLRPDGMSQTLLATAFAQALATILALVLDTRLGVLGLNAFFLILFIGSALLFRYANRQNFEAELTT